MSTHIHVWLSNNQCSHCPTTKDRYILQLEQDLTATQQRLVEAERLITRWAQEYTTISKERDALRAELGRCVEALHNLIEAAKPCRIRVSDSQPRRWIILHDRVTEGAAALSHPTYTPPGPAGEAREEARA